jgi:hypothetical protein
MKSISDLVGRIRPNILLSMILVSALGAISMYIGWKMDFTEIVAGASGTTILAISNLAMKILEKD